MMKKILAVTLALIVMLQPMAASAVTWSTLTANLAASGSNSYTYTDAENGDTVITESDGTTTISGGAVEIDHSVDNWISDAGVYKFEGVQLTNLIAGLMDNNSETTMLEVWLDEDTVVTGYVNMISWGDNNVVALHNYGTIADDPTTEDGEGNVFTESYDGAVLSIVNHEGAVIEGATNIYIVNATGESINEGTIGDYMSVTADGEDAKVAYYIGENATVGDAYVGVYNGAECVLAQNDGTISCLILQTDGGSDAVFTNNGVMVDCFAKTKMGTDSTSTIVNNGTLYNPLASIEYVVGDDLSDIPSNEELAKAAAEALRYTGVTSEDGTIVLEILLMNENGDLITRDGELIDTPEKEMELIEYIVVDLEDYENEVGEPDEGEPGSEEEGITEEEEPYDEYKAQQEAEEALRQSRAVGGVTTSIFWNYQMYLGHSTYNGRVYYQGEKEMTLQSINWLPDGGKNYTLRINKNEPALADVEIRVAQDILDVCERCGITTITLVDKEEIPFAQFAVADLIGAREMHGLEAEELLCVSADPEAEVMKVNLEGEYLPLEEAAEEDAQA